MDKPTAGLRKRQQIVRANQSMFLAIAGASVVVGFSIVLIVFLAQKIWYGEKVITEKNKTVTVLTKNLSAVGSLKENIQVLNTDQNLNATKLNDGDPAAKSVLDALPADANSTSMASSLQTRLLSGVDGVVIDSLKVDPVSGIEVADGEGGGDSSDPSTHTINFSFSVSTLSTNQAGLQKVLQRLEKSIRPFTITAMSVQSQGNRLVLSANGVGYYEPAQSIDLKKKVVRP